MFYESKCWTFNKQYIQNSFVAWDEKMCQVNRKDG